LIGMDWQPLGGSTMRMNLNVPLSSYASSVSDIRVGGPSAQLAAVGGRRVVMLFDLDHPWQPLLSLRPPLRAGPDVKGKAWDAVKLCWNLAPGHRTTLASSNNRDVLIWDVDEYQKAPVVIRDANQRPITGLGFATDNPFVLTTSSMDNQVNLWDLRALRGDGGGAASGSSSAKRTAGGVPLLPQRPILVLTEPGLPGASVLAWNRHNGNVLATAHANQLWLWDIRVGGDLSLFVSY
jgi:WD40 repeat protein